jgi:hypothetical protein
MFTFSTHEAVTFAATTNNPTNMAEIVFTKTVRQDEEGLVQITPLKADGSLAEVDNGYEDIVIEGGAETVLDPSDATGLTVIMKSDLTATEFPSTSTTRGTIDADLGEGKRAIDITLITVTVAAEAVTAGVNDLGNRPRS